MKRKIRSVLTALAGAVMSVTAIAIPAFAAGDDVTTIMETGLNSMKTDVLGIIAVALPIALGIFAIFFGVRKGIAMLRGVSNA